MANKYAVYSHTRGARQLAGDVVNSLNWNHPDKKAWEDIEAALNDIECKLERMDLKKEESKNG